MSKLVQYQGYVSDVGQLFLVPSQRPAISESYEVAFFGEGLS